MTLTPARAVPDRAPVDAGGLASALRPFGQSTMLPVESYTSAEVLAWEQRHFVAGSWACLGRVEDLRLDDGGRPLTQRAVMVGDISLVLTFADSGARALANTCRHRGHELLPDGGASTRRAITCPYHAWSYDLSGELIAAPGFTEGATFEAAGYPLVEVPSATWHGWFFVNATGTAGPFDAHIGGLGELVAPYAPERLVRRARHTYEVAANWKLVVENYHECYHCPLIHPELCVVSPPTSGDNYDLPGAWVGGSMDLAEGAVTMSISGESAGVPISGARPGKVEYLGLFPNLLISAHPDYVMTHRMVPLAPDRTWIECSWYFADPAVDPSYAVEFWDLTNKQDWGACESVQRGLRSPHFRPGPFAPGEDAVHQWVTMVGRGYQGVPPHVRD